jgi:FkbM family methyltransferase
LSQVRSDLVYDVGLFDGGDTAYYLFRGYNVVAVDANPVMVEKARTQFAKEIKEKKLTLLNVGISSAPGTANFWVSDHAEWSSFDRAIASRDCTAHSAVAVSVLPFAEIMEEYGVPHYLKIDIEGNDRLCVEALRGTTLPRYVSVESECAGDSVLLSDEEATAMLQLLRDIGYVKFKLVDQARGWTSVRPNRAARLSMRLATSVAHGRLRIKGLSAIAEQFTDIPRIASLGFDFPCGSSGPFGEDVPGEWMPFEKARSVYLQERHAVFARNRLLPGMLAKDKPLWSFWYDWHATY